SPDTSGTPRPPLEPEGAGTPAFFCHTGSVKSLLTPPPVAPPALPSFHTVSLDMLVPLPSSFVPPQASTCGLDAGKSTFSPVAPSLDPLSPDATVIVTPTAAADWHASSKAVSEACTQFPSGPPQLIEITDGVWVVSCTAVEIASMNPWSVFGAKYTAILAPGAMAPATSMSSATSPSALSGVVGAFVPPSTETETTAGVERFSPEKYVERSLAR